MRFFLSLSFSPSLSLPPFFFHYAIKKGQENRGGSLSNLHENLLRMEERVYSVAMIPTVCMGTISEKRALGKDRTVKIR